MRTELAIVFSLISVPALAAEDCKPLAALKRAVHAEDGKTHFTPLTPGQFNFAAGAFVATPPIDGKPPPGSSALLAIHDGQPGGAVLWMRGDMVCGFMPLPDEFLATMRGVKTGKLDPDGNEI